MNDQFHQHRFAHDPLVPLWLLPSGYEKGKQTKRTENNQSYNTHGVDNCESEGNMGERFVRQSQSQRTKVMGKRKKGQPRTLEQQQQQQQGLCQKHNLLTHSFSKWVVVGASKLAHFRAGFGLGSSRHTQTHTHTHTHIKHPHTKARCVRNINQNNSTTQQHNRRTETRRNLLPPLQMTLRATPGRGFSRPIEPSPPVFSVSKIITKDGEAQSGLTGDRSVAKYDIVLLETATPAYHIN